MVISRTAEYALRAVLYLAAQEREGAAQTVEQIAGGTSVPSGYLAKVLQNLARSGIITSQRGVAGGFRLVKTADELSVYEVVNAVDAIQRILECPLGIESHGSNLCPLHRRLDDVMALIEEQFRATKIRELLDVPNDNSQSRFGGENCVFPLRS